MTRLKTFADLAATILEEQRRDAAKTKQERTERKRARQEQAVVGGVYKPEPIDRAAAMLLARAPWWAFAASTKQEAKREKGMKNERGISTQKMGEAVANFAHKFGSSPEEILGPTEADGSCIAAENMINVLIRHVESKTPEKTRAIALAALGSEEAIRNSVVGLMTAVNDLDRSMTSAVQKLRSMRMSIVSDSSSAVNALRDIRQFFLGPDYEREQKRLAEFVDLCERLKRLKDSGFLDTVADTMIRLASTGGE